MTYLSEYFRSVGDVWIWWFISVFVVGLLTVKALSQVSWQKLRQVLGNDEEGASYALAYVLTFPIYLLLISLMIEASLILIVKFGTVHAAYAAARAATVWRPIARDPGARPEDQEVAQKKIQDAAILAITPFASSIPKHAQQMFPADFKSSLTQGIAYRQAYTTLESDNINQDPHKLRARFVATPDAMVSSNYTAAKHRFATLATRVEITPPDTPWNADLTATVSYEMPMHVPGAGRLLGNPWQPSRFFARVITSSVTIPSESPRNDNAQIGIGYVPNY